MVDHNIQQLKGALRRWYLGSRLQGQNAYRSFDIGFEDANSHVLISVVEGPSEAASWHEIPSGPAHFERVACAFTLPAGVLAELLALSGGMHAVLDLALRVRKVDRPVGTDELEQQLASMQRVALATAHSIVGRPVARGGITLTVRRLVIGVLTHPVKVASSHAEAVERMMRRDENAHWVIDDGNESDPTVALAGDGGLLEMINDMRWHEMLVLVGRLANVFSSYDKAAEESRGWVETGFSLPTSGLSLFVVFAEPMYGRTGDEFASQVWMEIARDAMALNGGYGVVGMGFLMHHKRQPDVWFVIQRRVQPSRLSRRLGKMRAKRGLGAKREP